MTFDLTTFLLEILNFIVLMWLLKRFLYKPVLKIIDERQQSIEKQVAEVKDKSAEAESLKCQYDDRLKQWDQEKADLQSALRDEMQLERERQLNKIRQDIENEEKRNQALTELKLREEKRQHEQIALDLALQLTSKILSQLASPELERRICKLFLDDLRKREFAASANLATDNGKNGSIICVSSAFPLSADLKTEIEAALNDATGNKGLYEYSQDPELIAGLKVTTGGTVLEASLKDAPSFLQELESSVKQS